ncbi:uncharacterized protein N7515_001494 [Penicillium bovifimosum]|uniref:Uncharacterized protein n=1 Tax=Penicillium bovifimosum TaxID=126998 RepID=A0A9W9H9S0_9EURO|nr:uncharacterized protein N7515_001494 [Penicillium bovifimosum]KAJ5142707.1 hypothetical protein N7515_001494 [Penicillium bovifimosum]
MQRQSMFYCDGTLIPEPEHNPRQVNNWVTVFLNARDSTASDEDLLRLVATYIRTGAATISVRPMHHAYPLCISIKVPGNYHSNKASIYAAAELQADHYRQEVVAGRVSINREMLFRKY